MQAHQSSVPPAALTVAILAGGLGTRLRAVVSDRPKVLAEAAGRPFLAWWLDALDAQGFRDVVLCTGFKAAQVREMFGSTHGHLRLRYSVESQPLGTGGALRHALPFFASDLILVLNGDSFCDVDLRGFVQEHAERQACSSLVLAKVADISRFGLVTFRTDGGLEAFHEKNGDHCPGWINAGIYLFSRGALASLPAGQNISLERDLLPRWMTQGIQCHPCHGQFIDIGTPESLAQADAFFARPGLAVA
ncbi:MAG: nucleotidyltransferase family protein [Verrucomicrobiales bacterium]|nr:nucleotidyltransferase family protein [Verrucomicrobiales bacterium]